MNFKYPDNLKYLNKVEKFTTFRDLLKEFQNLIDQEKGTYNVFEPPEDLCHNCLDCEKCLDCCDCFNCHFCKGCKFCLYCYSCYGKEHCLFCYSLTNKQKGYWLLNKRISREEFVFVKEIIVAIGCLY